MIHCYYKKIERERKETLLLGTLIGFMAGITLGGGTGILVAPKSGKQTRKEIKKDVKAKEKDAQDVKDVAEQDFTHLKRTLSNFKTKDTIKNKLNK